MAKRKENKQTILTLLSKKWIPFLFFMKKKKELKVDIFLPYIRLIEAHSWFPPQTVKKYLRVFV
jgi:hypothetical protein